MIVISYQRVANHIELSPVVPNSRAATQCRALARLELGYGSGGKVHMCSCTSVKLYLWKQCTHTLNHPLPHHSLFAEPERLEWTYRKYTAWKQYMLVLTALNFQIEWFFQRKWEKHCIILIPLFNLWYNFGVKKICQFNLITDNWRKKQWIHSKSIHKCYEKIS